LKSFLDGYRGGLAQCGQPLEGEDMFHGFHDWVAKEFGHSESTAGWCNMIIWKAGSDEKAYDLFFDLLDRYQKEQSAAQIG
jgi:hypothetical protein